MDGFECVLTAIILSIWFIPMIFSWLTIPEEDDVTGSHFKMVILSMIPGMGLFLMPLILEANHYRYEKLDNKN